MQQRHTHAFQMPGQEPRHFGIELVSQFWVFIAALKISQGGCVHHHVRSGGFQLFAQMRGIRQVKLVHSEGRLGKRLSIRPADNVISLTLGIQGQVQPQVPARAGNK